MALDVASTGLLAVGGVRNSHVGAGDRLAMFHRQGRAGGNGLQRHAVGLGLASNQPLPSIGTLANNFSGISGKRC